jgi:hypothetical protein
MELKNAVAVCLISLFSATLVVLIARALDLNAASRLEPQLARIVEELQAIRAAGGIASGNAVATTEQTLGDGLVVYYFYSNTRCPTCRTIETQSQETVQTDFATQLDAGEVVWKTLNYEEPSGADLAATFEIQMPVVVLAQMKDGQIDNWKRLDAVWGLVSDKPAFADFIRTEVNQMLDSASPTLSSEPSGDSPSIPIPVDDTETEDVPIPTDPVEIPIPQ